MTEERKTVDQFAGMLWDMAPSSYVARRLEGHFRAVVDQAREEGAVKQRLMDAYQDEKTVADLETMRDVAKARHDKLVAARELNAELLEACKAMIAWDDREQDHAIDFYARMELCRVAFEKARAAIARAEAAQKGGA